MDSNHHTHRYSCNPHDHCDAFDRYPNGYQYPHTNSDLNLHPHANSYAVAYVIAYLHAIVDIYSHPNQPANGHLHAFIHASAHVHPNAIYYTFPVNNAAPLK